MTPTDKAFSALRSGDLAALRVALDEGVDFHEARDGMTLLHCAIDSEIDAATQTGDPLEMAASALLLLRGASGRYVACGSISAEHYAFQWDHWLVLELIERLEGPPHRVA